MAMKKYTKGEGKIEVFRGAEAAVVSRHMTRTGKSLEDFTDEERDAFHADLDAVRESSDDDKAAESSSFDADMSSSDD